MTAQPFVPPPDPYDRLDSLAKLAATHDGGVIDLSIGTPCDAPTAAVIAALATSNAERGYPASIGSEPLRGAARDWMRRRFDVDVPSAQIAVCVGSKEFVASTPHYMKLRRPDRKYTNMCLTLGANRRTLSGMTSDNTNPIARLGDRQRKILVYIDDCCRRAGSVGNCSR